MNLLPLEQIKHRIYFIRGRKVMIDSDLAALYGVTTFNMNKAVRRNLKRFPSDFMYQLTADEFRSLIFQIGISNRGRGGRRHRPWVFTRDGVSMLSSILRSERAIQVNITIMRVFGQVEEMLATHKDLARKLIELEREYDSKFKVVFDAIRKLMNPSRSLTPIQVKGFQKP